MSLRSSKNRRRVEPTERARRAKVTFRGVMRGLLKLGVLVGLVGGMGYGGRETYRWATTSPRFALTDLTFVGLSRTRSTELIRLMGIPRGQNLFRVDVAAAERAVASHPWVRAVSVSRRFPREVRVTVAEHLPRAFVALGELYVVNDDGMPFKQLQPEDGLDLPLLTGVDRERYLEQPSVYEERFLRALELAETYGSSRAARGARLSEIRLEDEGPVLVVGEGEEILLGEGFLEQKLARLERVRTELGQRGLKAERIRLDNRSRPGWVAVQLAELTP